MALSYRDWLRKKDKVYLAKYLQTYNKHFLNYDIDRLSTKELFEIRKGFDVKSVLGLSPDAKEIKKFEMIHDTIVYRLKMGDEDVDREVRELIESGEEMAMTYALLYTNNQALRDIAILSLYQFYKKEGVDLITPFLEKAKDVSSTALTDANIFLSLINIIQKYTEDEVNLEAEDVSFIVKSLMKVPERYAILESLLYDVIDRARDPDLLVAVLANPAFDLDLRVQAYRYLRIRNADEYLRKAVAIRKGDHLLEVIDALLTIKDESVPRHKVLRALNSIYENLYILGVNFKNDINIVISRIENFPDNLKMVEMKRLGKRISELWGEALASFVYVDNEDVRKMALNRMISSKDIIALQFVIDDKRLGDLDIDTVEVVIRIYLYYTENEKWPEETLTKKKE